MGSVRSPGPELSYAGPNPFLPLQQLGWALLNSCSAPLGTRGDNCQLKSAAVPVHLPKQHLPPCGQGPAWLQSSIAAEKTV